MSDQADQWSLAHVWQLPDGECCSVVWRIFLLNEQIFIFQKT